MVSPQPTFSSIGGIPGLSSSSAVFSLQNTVFHKVQEEAKELIIRLYELAKEDEYNDVRLREIVAEWGDSYGWEVKVDLDDQFLEEDVKERALKRMEKRKSWSEAKEKQWKARMEAMRTIVDNELLNWVLPIAKADLTLSNITILLRVIVAFRDAEISEMSLPLTVIENIFEVSTIEDIGNIFPWLEDNLATVIKGFVPLTGPSLVLLRTLNELLRRLSRTRDTQLSARILVYLSKAISLSDKSGLNLNGKANVGNVTEWERKEQGYSEAELRYQKRNSSDHDEEEQKREEVEEIALSAALPGVDISKAGPNAKKPPPPPPPIDSYEKFWTLQWYLADPTRMCISTAHHHWDGLNSSESHFKVVKPLITHTIELFKGANKKDKALRGEEEEREKEKVGAVGSKLQHKGETRSWFFPKYLTNRTLFDLQVADVYFRRHVLVQILIQIQYMRGFSKAEREKSSHLSRNKILPDFILVEEDDRFLSATWNSVLREIRDSGPPGEGQAFMDSVRLVLAREKNWITWKAANCWLFEKQMTEEERESTDGKAREFKRKLQQRPRPTGPLGFAKMVFRPAKMSKDDDVTMRSGDEETKKTLYEYKYQIEQIDERTGLEDVLQKIRSLKEQKEKKKVEKLEREKAQKAGEEVGTEQEKKNEETDEDGEINSELKELENRKRRIEEEKSSINWRAFRLASTSYLRLMGKAITPGSGADLTKLIQAIEDEASGKFKPQRKKESRNLSTPKEGEESKIGSESQKEKEEEEEELNLVELLPEKEKEKEIKDKDGDTVMKEDTEGAGAEQEVVKEAMDQSLALSVEIVDEQVGKKRQRQEEDDEDAEAKKAKTVDMVSVIH